MKNIINWVLVFFLIFLLSCSNDSSDREIEYQLPSTFQPTNQIRYTVEGGGDIDFILKNNTDSVSVTVSRFRFEPCDYCLLIAKSDIDSMDMVIIKALFQGTIDIGGIIYKNNLPVGSWTYLYISYNNNWLRVANQAIINELGSVYTLILDKSNTKIN